MRTGSRFGYGLLLMTEPDLLLRLGARERQPSWARPVLRVLGARHVAQAVLLSPRPIAPLGAVIDVLHIATDLACATVVPSMRIPALTDATVASSLATADVRGPGRRVG